MDFAKNLLLKYGWKDGQGIGKNSDGIVKPIKANLKFDSAGLGHDRAKEFTNHWWETAFNDAASNLNVDKAEGNVSISLKDSESIEITTNGFSAKKLAKSRSDKSNDYGGSFLKSRSTLHKEASSDGETDEDAEQIVASATTSILTDEDLLKACGGRTAHKGARHGLRLNGKLSRIEEQERQLLENYSKSSFNTDTAQDVFKDWVQVDEKKSQRKKKKQNKSADTNIVAESSKDTVDNADCTTPITPDSEHLATLLNQSDYVVKFKSKKKKKRHRALDEDLAESLNRSLSTSSPVKEPETPIHKIQDSSKAIKKKRKKNRAEKKKKKRAKLGVDESTGLINEDVEIRDSDSCKYVVNNPIAEKYLKRSIEKQKKEENKDEGDAVQLSSSKKRKRKASKPDKTDFTIDDNDDISSDGDDGVQRKDRLVEYIKGEMQRQPRKKFKIVAENLTPFQSKHLQKAGITLEVNKTTVDSKKLKKERKQMQKIAKQLENAMNLTEDAGEDVVDAGVADSVSEPKKKRKKSKK